MNKSVKKLLGGIFAILLAFVSVLNVNAALYTTVGDRDTTLALFKTLEGDTDPSEGYIKMEVTSVTGNVIKVDLTVSTKTTDGKVSKPVEGGSGAVLLTDEIVNNYVVTVVGEGFGYDEATKTINWVNVEVPVDSEKAVSYVLTPKSTYALGNDAEFHVADSFVFTHGELPGITITFKDYIDSIPCMPYVKLSDVTNSETGLFTDVIILSAIVVAATGILILTLKSNKFAKI